MILKGLMIFFKIGLSLISSILGMVLGASLGFLIGGFLGLFLGPLGILAVLGVIGKGHNKTRTGILRGDL